MNIPVEIRETPLWDFAPAIHELTRTIPRGQQLVRIFDADKAAAGGYSGFDYNPNPIVDDRPSVRGRFSARIPQRPTEELYSYLYVAEHVLDELPALLECIFILGYGRANGSGRRTVDFSSIAPFAFGYTTTDRPLTLLDISSSTKADKLMADYAVLQGFDYQKTREWSAYFRSLSPHFDGIYYSPVQYGELDRGGNILLFGPPGLNGDHLSPVQTARRFNEHGGRARLFALQDVANVAFQNMIA